jgi:hypothetical protein
MAPAQPRAIVFPPRDTRASRELWLMVALRREKAHLLDSNPFICHVTGELQQVFETQCQVDSAGATIIDVEQLAQRQLECVKAGLYALRRILTAWLKYPAVGGRLDGAQIGVIDFRFTAISAVVEKPEGQIAAQYARIMANTVDPLQDDIENAPHAQLRVNNCFLAIKKQFMALFDLLDPERLNNYLFEDDTMSEDEAEPTTYTLPTTAALHPPSNAAQLMSVRGLIEAAETEDDDNQHVFVTGGVLKTKAEKRADLTVQVAKAKKAEAEEDASAKVVASAAKSAAAAKGKSRVSKSNDSLVESGEDEGDGEAVDSPTKKPTAKTDAAKKIKGGRKRNSDYEASGNEENNADPTPRPAKQPKLILGKRSAPAPDAEEADEDDTTPKPAPKKRAKSTPAVTTTASKKTASDKSPEKSPASGTSGEAGSVAPNIVKRGGAAPKWLKDEDDLVKQMIVDHPTWPMPQVYREYSIQVANTLYQRAGQVLPEYRADFVEFPKDIIASDKERRKYDIAWRTYESVRQHTEKFKAHVSNANYSAPYTWVPAQANLVAGKPKRAPPPRPSYFNNDARTPVPPASGTVALSASAPPAVPSSVTAGTAAPPSAPAASAGTRRSSGWNAINNPAPVTHNTPEQADDEAIQPAEGTAGGDAGVDTLGDFVAQQSAASSAGEVEDDEDIFD